MPVPGYEAYPVPPPLSPHAVAPVVEALQRLQYRAPGRVVGIWEKPGEGLHAPCSVTTLEAGVGLTNDWRGKDWYLGRRVPGREVSAVASEVMAALGIPPGVIGDNLVLAGVDLRALQPGDRLSIGADVVLERSEAPHRPCPKFCARTSPLAYWATREGDFRGALFSVAAGGTVRVGDKVRVERSG
jgi:hypothetical protein